MTYRKAETEDVKQLVELRKKQLIDEGGYPQEHIDEELEKFFSCGLKDETLVVWLAAEGECIIATCGVCFFQYPPSFSNTTGKIAYITNVYTETEYRRRGIATRLLELILGEIADKGCKVARLHASSQGRRLYERKGFAATEGFMSKNMQDGY